MLKFWCSNMWLIKFLTLFFCATTVAQNYGVLQYKVAVIDSTFLNNEYNSKLPEFKLINNDLIDECFEIINFNDTIACSEEYKFNASDMGKTLFNMIILNKCSNKNLFNYKKTIISEAPDNLNVIVDYNNEWQITNESKIINNKKCYKAIIIFDYPFVVITL